VLAPTASAATRSYEGTVVSATRFERISGFSALRAGQRRIEVTVRRSDGRWVAVSVERSGGGGHHGDDD
jgi:hypothetical protein